MFNTQAEQGLKEILNAVRHHIPTHAMQMLEDSIRSYGKLCGHDAVIEYISKKQMQGG